MQIIINNSMEARMLQDFELEASQCKGLMEKVSKQSDVWQLAANRLRVVEASVVELKKAMQNPLHFKNRQEGGYSEEELQRMEKFGNRFQNMGKVNQSTVNQMIKV